MSLSSIDLSEITSGRVGIACELYDEPEGHVTRITRFARVDKLTADDRGLCLAVTYDDGETEIVHIGRITYVDGKAVL